jgi:hypothetical protein
MNHNPIYGVCAFVFVVATSVVGKSLALHALVGVLFGSFATVWSLYSGLWHWNELPPSERFWTVIGVLGGPVILLLALNEIIQKAPDLLGSNSPWRAAVLYVAILVYSLLLAGMTEVTRKARLSPPRDDRHATDL